MYMIHLLDLSQSFFLTNSFSFARLSSEVGCRWNGDLTQDYDDVADVVVIFLFLHIHFPILLRLLSPSPSSPLSSSTPPSPLPSPLNPVCICWYLWQIAGCRVRKLVRCRNPKKWKDFALLLIFDCRQSVAVVGTFTRSFMCTGVKGKAIPLQAWTGPEGSRRLRLPDFKTIGT